MPKRQFFIGVAVSALVASGGAAAAQEVLKLGLIEPMTGIFSTGGKAIVNGALLYLKQRGDMVAGRKIQVIVKDDMSAPDTAKRRAQELIVNDRVAILGAGVGTPSALSIAPVVTEAKIPTVVMLAGASVVVERSAYMARTSFTVG
jgi:branched-chain amino acid transport system substrate-binding protein